MDVNHVVYSHMLETGEFLEKKTCMHAVLHAVLHYTVWSSCMKSILIVVAFSLYVWIVLIQWCMSSLKMWFSAIIEKANKSEMFISEYPYTCTEELVKM